MIDHDDNVARLREREEEEISALASMIADNYEAPDPDALAMLSNLNADAVNAFACMVLNNAIVHLSEHVIACHECEEAIQFNGTVRAAAEYVWGKDWMLYHGNPLCFICQF